MPTKLLKMKTKTRSPELLPPPSRSNTDGRSIISASTSRGTDNTRTGGGDHTKNSNKSATTSADEKILEIDEPIQKRYAVKTRLGKGAYGIVWEAEELSSGNEVALKKIFDAFRNDTDAQRTYREIIFLREFGHHPNIIRLINAHRASNNLDIYLVFPLMDSDLHKVIKNSPDRLKDSNIRRIFYQILTAVKYLHSAEVIHRDLKPANILLDDFFHVKVADFGLARSVYNLDVQDQGDKGSDSIMTDYVATRWYRPPEILLSCTRYSKAVDMWSLGCILAEMIRKKALFPGNTTIEQIEIVMGIIEEPTAAHIEDLCTSTTKPMIDAALGYRKESLADIFSKCEYNTIDLIESLLLFHPSQRLTVEQTLGHSFLARHRVEAEELTFDYPVIPPLNDNVQLAMNDYRGVIYEMIKTKRLRLLLPSPRPSLIPVSKSAIGMISSAAAAMKGKPVSVLTLPRKQSNGGIQGITAGLAGMTLAKKNSSKESQRNIKLKNARSSTTFSNNKNVMERENTRQFKPRSHFTRTTEGDKSSGPGLGNSNPNPAPEANKITAKSKRKVYSWEEENSEEFIAPNVAEADLWNTSAEKFDDEPVLIEESNVLPPLTVPNYVARSLLPVHTTMSPRRRPNIPPKIIEESDNDTSVLHRPISRSALDIGVLFSHSVEEMPNRKDRGQLQQQKGGLNRVSTSIPWLPDLSRGNKSQKYPGPGPGGDRNTFQQINGRSTAAGVIGAGASRSRDMGLNMAVPPSQTQWDQNHPDDRDRERDRDRFPVGRGRVNANLRSKAASTFSTKAQVLGKAQIKHELNMSTILQSWSGESKSVTTAKSQGQGSAKASRIPSPAYDSTVAPRSRPQRYTSSYFPEGQGRAVGNNKNSSRKQGQEGVRRTPYDYSKSHGTINASDLSEIRNYGRESTEKPTQMNYY